MAVADPALRRLAVAAAVATTACAQTVPSTAPNLADTRWALRSIQSMDDRQGTTLIEDPSRFTLRLGADGRRRHLRVAALARMSPVHPAATGMASFMPLKRRAVGGSSAVQRVRSSRSTFQPLRRAIDSRRGSGSTTIGSRTTLSSARSLIESV